MFLIKLYHRFFTCPKQGHSPAIRLGTDCVFCGVKLPGVWE